MKIAVKKTAQQVARDWDNAHLAGMEAVEAITTAEKTAALVIPQGVVARTAQQGVVGRATREGVIPATAFQPVAALLAL